jgi:hypothetical protein
MACSSVMLIAPVCGRWVMVAVAVMSLIWGRMPWSSSCVGRACRGDRGHAVSHPAWLSWFRRRVVMILVEMAEPSALLAK